METIRNHFRLEFNKKYEYKKILKQQSKLTFNGVHTSYEKCDSYLFREIEVLMDKPSCLGLAVFALSKLLRYETYYDKLQPYFGQENIQCHYMDSVSKDTPIIMKGKEKKSKFWELMYLLKNKIGIEMIL